MRTQRLESLLQVERSEFDSKSLEASYGWAHVPRQILSERLLPLLSKESRRSAHLACKLWAAAVVSGLEHHSVRGSDDGPQGWGSRFTGLKSLCWTRAGQRSLWRHKGELESLAALTSLKLTGADDGSLSAISSLTGIRIIDLSHCCQITDSGFRELRRLASLTFLNLDGCPLVSAEGLRELQTLPHLATVRLAGCHGVTDAALQQPVLPPSLTALTLGRSITDQGITAARNRTRLTSLDLHGSALTDHGITWGLCHLMSLRSLHLECCSLITDSGLSCLSRLACLETLAVEWCCSITGIGLEALHPLDRLAVLSIESCCAFADVGIAAICSSCTSLQSLRLADQENVTDLGFQNLTALSGLTSLSLCCCPGLGDAGLAAACRLPLLTSLDASDCRRFSDIGILAGLGARGRNTRCIEFLSLTPGPTVTARGLAALSALRSLKSLRLSGSHAVDDRTLAAAALPSAATLAELDVSSTSVSGHGLQLFQHLTTLNLSFCYRLSNNLEALFTSLHSLTSLQLSGCTVVTDQRLLSMLPPMTSLTALNISLCTNANPCSTAAVGTAAAQPQTLHQDQPRPECTHPRQATG